MQMFNFQEKIESPRLSKSFSRQEQPNRIEVIIKFLHDRYNSADGAVSQEKFFKDASSIDKIVRNRWVYKGLLHLGSQRLCQAQKCFKEVLGFNNQPEPCPQPILNRLPLKKVESYLNANKDVYSIVNKLNEKIQGFQNKLIGASLLCDQDAEAYKNELEKFASLSEEQTLPFIC